MTILTTPRLRLEPINQNHFDAFYEMNSDPTVMRFITGQPDTPEDTQAGIDRIQARWKEWGYSWWALIERESERLVGAACLQHLNRDKNCPHEIGWRLRQDAWGKGYASEAAERIVEFAFTEIHAEEVRAICYPANQNSIKVMLRLGMEFDGEQLWYEEMLTTYVLRRDRWIAARIHSREEQPK